jgi:hypothetical protein
VRGLLLVVVLVVLVVLVVVVLMVVLMVLVLACSWLLKCSVLRTTEGLCIADVMQQHPLQDVVGTLVGVALTWRTGCPPLQVWRAWCSLACASTARPSSARCSP